MARSWRMRTTLPRASIPIARIYAATGDITATGTYGRRTWRKRHSQVYQRIEINRPTKVYAGRDIIDLNIIVQNIHTQRCEHDRGRVETSPTPASTMPAGCRWPDPGFLVVQAGGDIGPFLPAAHNNSTEAPVQEGIVSVGNSSPTPVGNCYIASASGGSLGWHLTISRCSDRRNNPRRNALLTQSGRHRRGAPTSSRCSAPSSGSTTRR